MALGLLDRCCSAETMMRFPAIYKMSQNRSDFNIKVYTNDISAFVCLFILCVWQVFWTWCLNAVYHSIILYFMSYAMLRHGMFKRICFPSFVFVLRYRLDRVFLFGDIFIQWDMYLDIAHPSGLVFGSHVFLGNCVYTVNWVFLNWSNDWVLEY